MWPFSTSATRVSLQAGLIKRMLPMGGPRARASGLAVRRTGSGGIERFRKAREESVPSRTHRRGPAAAWAVHGRRAWGVHESQDSLEVLWCCFPRVGNPGLGVAGVIALGRPEGLRRTLRRPRDAGPVKKSLSVLILADNQAPAQAIRRTPRFQGVLSLPQAQASAMARCGLLGGAGRARVSRWSRSATQPSVSAARLSSTSPRSSPAWRTMS